MDCLPGLFKRAGNIFDDLQYIRQNVILKWKSCKTTLVSWGLEHELCDSLVLVHRCTNSRVNSTRYPRHLHACEASRRPHYAVASQTHS